MWTKNRLFTRADKLLSIYYTFLGRFADNIVHIYYIPYYIIYACESMNSNDVNNNFFSIQSDFRDTQSMKNLYNSFKTNPSFTFTSNHTLPSFFFISVHFTQNVQKRIVETTIVFIVFMLNMTWIVCPPVCPYDPKN